MSDEENASEPFLITPVKSGRVVGETVLIKVWFDSNDRKPYPDANFGDDVHLHGDASMSEWHLHEAGQQPHSHQALTYQTIVIGIGEGEPVHLPPEVRDGGIARFGATATVAPTPTNPIIERLHAQGIDGTRLKNVLDTGDRWGDLVHAFEALTVLGVVADEMIKAEKAATPH